MNSKEIRKQFLAFYEGKQHKIVPSAPMVIKDDPTLLFTNAGMNQFKSYFLGIETPKNTRVTDTQKCLRVSGKHNDLEEVGKDTYHHTMFEMLGNWSFGDYFKEEAISWAWELLTKVFKIDEKSLYVSVFEGTEDADNLEKDSEAYALWQKIVPEDRIIFGNKKDNFWEMGAQGPCGPCSEIHVDIRPEAERNAISGASLVNKDHPQVVEIWNLVFMQYNRKADGILESLPEKHVDTGMGFERLCMVLQKVTSNYDTDVFTPLIKKVTDITNTTYGKELAVDIAIRVIVDHVRAVSFSIADGQLPSNTGAGYVIRRILRRAVRYGFTFLYAKEPFLYKLVPVLLAQMGDAYPELKAQAQLLGNVIKEEELSFLKTLDQGLVLLANIMAEATTKKVDGAKAFQLYDTFGFPIDLTSLILEEKGFSLDHTGFDIAMQEQKNRSKSAATLSKDDWEVLLPNTTQIFTGYDSLVENVKITKYRKITSKKDGVLYQVVFNKTPFYAEGGGQVGDTGVLKGVDGNAITIIDTKRENNEIVHFTKKLPVTISGDFEVFVDNNKRKLTNANHTATHLLHEALREVLGTHVAQKGSSVNHKQLRFDFSHFSKLTAVELQDVEAKVRAKIQAQLPLQEERNASMKEAVANGAIALFGEKYGDTVRTIQFGNSIELCGGTHVPNTSTIWDFKIVSEGAVASGVRRIEAITKDAVKDYYIATQKSLHAIQETLGAVQDPLKAVVKLQEEHFEIKKQLAILLKEKAKNLLHTLQGEIKEVNGVAYLAKKINLDAAAIKDLCFELGQNKKNLMLVFGTEQQGKAVLSCYISKELVTSKGLNAGTIVRELGKHIQGGGGGQAFFATAGGKNLAGIAIALEKAIDYLD